MRLIVMDSAGENHVRNSAPRLHLTPSPPLAYFGSFFASIPNQPLILAKLIQQVAVDVSLGGAVVDAEAAGRLLVIVCLGVHQAAVVA